MFHLASFLDYKNKLPFTEIIIQQHQYLPKPDLIVQLGASARNIMNAVNLLRLITLIDSRPSRHDPDILVLE